MSEIRLQEAEQEEAKFISSNRRLFQLESKVANIETLCWGCSYIITVVAFLVAFINNHDSITIKYVLLLLIASLPLSFFSFMILGFILTPIVEFFTYKYFKASKEELKQFQIKKASIKQTKDTLTKEVRSKHEDEFLKSLNIFLTRLKLKKLNVEEAVELEKKFQIQKQSFLWFYSNSNRGFIDDHFEMINKQIKKMLEEKNLSMDNSSIVESLSNSISQNQADDKHLIQHSKNQTDNEVSKPADALSKVIISPPTKSQIILEEKKIDKLFANSTIEQNIDKRVISEGQKIFKPNYTELNELRMNVGELGELFVIEVEKQKLLSNERQNLSEQIQHVAKTDDSKGYDIISFFKSGEPKYIEVKTTIENEKAPFFLTRNELQMMNELDNYFIYRVFNFEIEKRNGQYFILNCKKDIHKYFKIEPMSYQVSIKK